MPRFPYRYLNENNYQPNILVVIDNDNDNFNRQKDIDNLLYQKS